MHNAQSHASPLPRHAQLITLWHMSRGDEHAEARVHRTAIGQQLELRVNNETVFACVFDLACGWDHLRDLAATARSELESRGWRETPYEPRRCHGCGGELLERQQRYCSRECFVDAHRRRMRGSAGLGDAVAS
jgi:hypothetical protein